MIAADSNGKWVLDELWNTQVWGSPDVNIVQVQPALNEFLSKCKERDIMVGLSSWYRRDTTHLERKIKTPEDLADIWIATFYLDMPLTYSFDASDLSKYDNAKADYLDLYEHHVWMMKQNKSEFRKAVGYGYEKFSPAGYKNLVKMQNLYIGLNPNIGTIS